MTVGQAVLEYGQGYALIHVPLCHVVALGPVPYIGVTTARAGNDSQAIGVGSSPDAESGLCHIGYVHIHNPLGTGKSVIGWCTVGPKVDYGCGLGYLRSGRSLCSLGRRVVTCHPDLHVAVAAVCPCVVGDKT